MKIYLYLFIIVSSFIFNESAKSQDFEIFDNFSTHTNEALIHSVALNDSTIIVVGSHVILKTKNYGLTWVPTIIDGILNQVTFPTDSVGYAVGYNSLIMKTINQGNTWSALNTDVIENTHTAFTVEFLNIDTGFVALANGPGYAFLSTHDGGDTWQNADFGTVYGRAKLQIVNDSTVYALPYDNKFYKSTDYGESWEAIFLPENTGSSRDMHFFNKDTGIVAIREFSSSCGSNYYLATTYNGGESWTNQYYSCTNFRAFEFPNNDVGFSIGTYFSDSGVRTFWRTIDSGDTWEELEYPVGETHFGSSCMATCITCVNQDTCYMPTNYGTIIKMTNASGGLTAVGDNDSNSENQLLVYPNPNNGNFSFKSDINEIANIKIYSIDGKKVYEVDQVELGQHLQISVSNLSSGIYIYTIKTENEMFNGKFAKQ
ncbi:T9SS type A sorting domain-containing protein [Cryomorpha ignava]|uniref:T9SS type A sorting domain-containing protein n=1 Tax=Cryomorpha ignava TaxID=101383 RepID=A0A7K3WXH6_9FLAO|nr:T9SS type A sorting domain-containing protein [Cryomorpha ignava]NEN25801.1 T9SS type A sorting domain-containing protein [Cryomorpha ignava]